MRRYNISVGKYKGFHYIFDTENEAAHFLGLSSIKTCNYIFTVPNLLTEKVTAVSFGNDETFRHWSDARNRAGDWVRTDDGRIVQVLNWYIMPSTRRKVSFDESPYPIPGDTTYIRFPFASASVYYKADGTVRYNYLHADFFVVGNVNTKNIKKGSITKANSVAKKDKRLFAYYLVISGNPLKAYHLTFPKAYSNKLLLRHITRKALELVRDKAVLAEILKYMTIDEFKQQYKDAASKAGLNVDFLFSELVRGTKEADGGTDDHQKMLLMVAEVIEKINDVQILTQTGTPTKLDTVSSTAILPPPNDDIKKEVEKRTPQLLP